MPDQTTPARYRTRVREVDAIRWDGENVQAMSAFLGADYAGVKRSKEGRLCVMVRVLEDAESRVLPPGWFVWRDAKGWHHVADPEAFAATYEPVEGEHG